MASRVDKIYGDAYISVKTDEDDLLEALEEAKAVKEILDSNTDFVNFLNHPQITKEEKMYLERCGYGRKDFAQIQEATRRDKTTYEMDGAPITRDEAVTPFGAAWTTYPVSPGVHSLHSHAYHGGRESNPVRLVQAVWKGIVQWTIHT